MLYGLKERRTAEEGFTLIELMVVVLIIGILVAIALPTFLGARNRANDKAAQSGVRNAIAAAKTCFTDNDAYYSGAALCTDADLSSIETSLNFVPAATDSLGPNDVSILADPNFVEYFASWSKSGNCFYAADNPTANAINGTNSGTKFDKAADATHTACSANDAKATQPNAAQW